MLKCGRDNARPKASRRVYTQAADHAAHHDTPQHAFLAIPARLAHQRASPSVDTEAEIPRDKIEYKD